ncbi:MAG: ATP-binding protein [Desulfuromusa sp.]|jgi:signal transduction histidine kinase|nr:ATP-binding protein [Desulfuromusa sp.]
MKTLKGRLVLWYALLFTVMAMGVFFYIYTILVHDMGRRVDEELIDDALEIVDIFAESGLQATAREIHLEVDEEDHGRVFYRIFSPQQVVLAATNLESWQHLAIRPEKIPEQGEMNFASLIVPGHEFKVRSIYRHMQGGYLLQIGFEPVENGRLLQLFYESFGVAFAVLVLSGSFLGFLISRRALKGIDRLRESFERVGQENFNQPVAVGREGLEIETLIKAYNQMQQRIQTLIEELHNVTNNIAHDLRSPITRIRGMAETTLTSPQSVPAYQEMTGNVVEECDNLVGMISTMLEIAEADAGVIEIKPVRLDISAMIQDVSELFAPVAEDKKIDLLLELPAEPLLLYGDKTRLQRALANLLDNALKYTPREGKVTLSGIREDSQLHVSVEDTGIGISAKEQKYIFDRFYRVDLSRSTHGNGLGLSLVKSIVFLHHGSIKVISVEGKGSCFHLYLPIASVDSSEWQ